MLSVKSATFGSLENNCYLITDEKTNKSALIDLSLIHISEPTRRS